MQTATANNINFTNLAARNAPGSAEDGGKEVGARNSVDIHSLKN